MSVLKRPTMGSMRPTLPKAPRLLGDDGREVEYI
jgi:hypothetical protein